MPHPLRLRTSWSPDEIRGKLFWGSGFGFLFHATNRGNVSYGYVDNDSTPDDLWVTPASIVGPIFCDNMVVGCNLASPVFPELWVGNHHGIRRFRQSAFEPLLKLAETAGITHVGLGALFPFATDFGRCRVDRSVCLTTGHACTVAALGMMVQDVCQRAGIRLRDASCCVFGGAGSVGGSISRWLRYLGIGRLTIVDLAERKKILEELHRELSAMAGRGAGGVEVVTVDAAAGIKPFSIGVIATNKAAPWLGCEILKKSSFWIDDSHPRAILEEAERDLHGTVVCVECYVRGPHGLAQTVPFRLPSPRDCYSCFAEAYICWKEGMPSDFVVGRPTHEQVALAFELLSKYDFSIGEYVDKAGVCIETDRLSTAIEEVTQSVRR